MLSSPPSSSTNNIRDASRDIIRLIAFLMVILCHSVEQVFTSTTIIDNFFGMMFHTIGRIGVPLFFMLTGFYLLNKTYDSSSMKSFYLKSFLPLFLCWEIWVIIYNVAFVLSGQEFIGFAKLIKEMFFLESVEGRWYLPCILLMYLMIPFIANGLNTIKIKYTWVIF